jgi:hypothetical protein
MELYLAAFGTQYVAFIFGRALSLLHKKNAINDTEGDQMRLSALNNYINAVSKLASENNITTGIVIEGLEEQIARYNELEKTIQEQINEEREAAIAKYEQAVRRANDALSAGLIDQVEHSRQLAAAKAQEYADLEAIVTEYKLVTGETIRLRDETAEIVKLNQDNAAAMEKTKNGLTKYQRPKKNGRPSCSSRGIPLRSRRSSA